MAIDLITYEFLKKYVEGSAIPNTQPKGVYNSGINYETGSFVTFNNKVYIVPYGSIDENGKGVIQIVRNVTPGTDDQKWQLLISAGESYASKEDLDKLAGLDVKELEGEIDSVKEAAIAINKLPGQKIENGGEIFNDYEEKELENGKIDPPNQAISPYSHAEGYNTLVGQKGFQGDFFVKSSKETTVTFTISNSYSDIFDIISNNSSKIQGKIISAKLVPEIEKDDTNYNFVAIGKVTSVSLEGATISITITENTDYLNTNYAEDWENFKKAKVNSGSQFWFHELPDLGINEIDKGTAGHAEGRATTAIGYAHAEGYDTKALGYYSHAEGQSTVALHGAHSEGQGALASGTRSHAEGYYTKATNITSHAEGYTTRATGEHSHAEGYQNIASGKNSHAEGFLTFSEGENSHTEGNKTYAKGKNAHAEGLGLNTTEAVTEPMYTDLKYSIPKKDTNKNYGAIGDYSHSEGNSTYAKAENSHAEGHGTTASGKNSHAEGYNTTASGESSHAEGQSTTASGSRAHAEGQSTNAIGEQAHAEGNGTYAIGNWSHAEGGTGSTAGCKGYEIEKIEYSSENQSVKYTLKDYNNINNYSVNDVCSIVLDYSLYIDCGKITSINGNEITIVSIDNKTVPQKLAKNNYFFVKDKFTKGNIKFGSHSHAEGVSYALNNYAHAEGWNTKAWGIQSHAEGHQCESIGHYSHAEGIKTIASAQGSHVQGQYNIPGNYAHIVGWGSSDTNRKNIHTLDTIGNAWFAGDVTCTYNNKAYKMSDIIKALIELGKLS